MKVLQVLLPVGIGGVERIAGQLLNSPSDIESYVAIDESYCDGFIQQFGVQSSRLIPLDCSSTLKTIKSIKSCIETIHPDIVHTHARREMVYVSLCKKKSFHIRTQHMSESPKKPVTFIEKALIDKHIDKWVATSNQLAKSYLEKKEYIDKRKIMVIYNGAEQGPIRKSFDQKKHYCIICRLTKQKGIDLLMNEVASFKSSLKDSFNIDIWGAGEELSYLIGLASQLKIDNIFSYKGTTNSPASVVIDYDALLMPSRNEGLPLTMLECMSTATPVATHRVGCVEEFIVTANNGWIIDENYSWESFFEQNMQNDEYEQICENARMTYLEHFSVDAMKDNYFSLYRSVVAK